MTERSSDRSSDIDERNDEAQTTAHALAEKIGRKYQMNTAGRRQLEKLMFSMSNSEISDGGSVDPGIGLGRGTSGEDAFQEDSSMFSDSASRASGDAHWGQQSQRAAAREAQIQLAAAQQHAAHVARQRQDEERRQRQELELRLQQAASQIRVLREELQCLRQEKESAERSARLCEREYAHQAQTTQQQLDEALRQLSTLDEGGKSAKQALRDSLADHLLIGDEQARRTRALPPEQMGTADWVRLRLYDAQQDIRQERNELSTRVDTLRRETTEAQEAKRKAETDAENSMRELQSVRERSEQTENRCTVLEQEVARALRKSEDERVRLLQADRVLEERQELSAQLAKLRGEHDTVSSKAGILAEELERVQAQISEGRNRVWEATTQREAHEQVVSVLRKRQQELETEKTRLQNRNDDLQRQLDGMSERHRKDLTEMRAEADERSTKELTRIRDQAGKDLQSLRERCDSIKARELVQLTSERDRAQQEAQQLRLRLDELEATVRQERSEWRRVDEVTRSETSELRSELRMRNSELQLLEVRRGEQQRMNEELNIQAEREAQKLAALKDEFYDQQRVHSEDRAQMQAVIAARTEKLRIYEDLEADCDAAIERTAGAIDPGDEPRAAASLAQVPSAASRRIQQSLMLARKAMRLEKDLSGAEEALKEKAVQLLRAQQELERVKGVLGNQQQPYKYFVDTLAQRDATAERLQADLELAKGDVRDAEAEQRSLMQLNSQLQARLSQSQTELVRMQARHREFKEYLKNIKLIPGSADAPILELPRQKKKKRKTTPGPSQPPLIDLAAPPADVSLSAAPPAPPPVSTEAAPEGAGGLIVINA